MFSTNLFIPNNYYDGVQLMHIYYVMIWPFIKIYSKNISFYLCESYTASQTKYIFLFIELLFHVYNLPLQCSVDKIETEQENFKCHAQHVRISYREEDRKGNNNASGLWRWWRNSCRRQNVAFVADIRPEEHSGGGFKMVILFNYK